MGILDNKSRVLDTVMTLEGRRQLSQGGIDVKYVTFTDGAAFYRADVASGSQDATQRIYLESCQLPQDELTFQADDSGDLLPFRNSDSLSLANGTILDYSYQPVSSSVIGGSSQSVKPIRGASFKASSSAILASAAENLQNLYLVATFDKIFDDFGFALGPNSVSFQINSSRPISNSNQYVTHISALDSIFSDPRFSHLPNFKFLPPVNKLTDASLDPTDIRIMKPLFIAAYLPFGRTQVDGLSYSQTMSELQYYEQLGYMRQISFDPTSSNNRLVGQFFEQSFGGIRKLDVVDTGLRSTGNPGAPTSQIFFVGKVEVDDNGTDTFLHFFTLVFE